ncbi:hypothetical protein C1I95_14810 [Micromonospora craterilacus]|uniref:Uncharacterized protein n=1 Tax=Micromonospora craterilacus TaxID=1655439 RepID=A0A2W2EZ66_9ACTN|nr:hypothetical protein [Micromonospora craterilacus]PZG17818.1 hypothetical protein C1I95_14810 [Micromonospora craterilacus]
MTGGRTTARQADLDVPPGTRLFLLAGEWRPEPGKPASRDTLVSVVAVRQPSRGLVLIHGHACNPHNPDCGRHHCWEAHVVVAAITANLVGAR